MRFYYGGSIWKSGIENLKAMKHCMDLTDLLYMYALNIKNEHKRKSYIDHIKKWQSHDYRVNILKSESSTNLLERPVIISSHMPIIDTRNKLIVFGDFSYYWIIERMPLTIRLLFEKYILTQPKGFPGYANLTHRLLQTPQNKKNLHSR